MICGHCNKPKTQYRTCGHCALSRCEDCTVGYIHDVKNEAVYCKKCVYEIATNIYVLINQHDARIYDIESILTDILIGRYTDEE